MSDRIAAGVLIAVSVGFIVMAAGIRASNFSDPLGPRWVPIVIGVFLIAACVALLVKPLTATTWPDGATWARLAVCLIGFVAYANLLVPLGFILATTLAFALFAMLFRAGPVRALVAGTIFAFASYGLFSMALDLFQPTGRLFQGWF